MQVVIAVLKESHGQYGVGKVDVRDDLRARTKIEK